MLGLLLEEVVPEVALLRRVPVLAEVVRVLVRQFRPELRQPAVRPLQHRLLRPLRLVGRGLLPLLLLRGVGPLPLVRGVLVGQQVRAASLAPSSAS